MKTINIIDQNLIAYWPLNEGESNKSQELIDNKEYKINYVFNRAAYKENSSPIWKKGIKSRALLFDGFSTWIETEKNNLMEGVSSFSISVWIAPRTFKGERDNHLAPIICQHNKQKNKGFNFGLYLNGEISFQLGTNDNWIELWSEKYIDKKEWVFLTAVYDNLENEMVIYFNGEKINSKKLPKNDDFSAAFKKLFIAKDDNSKLIAEKFNLSMYSGLMNDLKIYDKALEEKEVKTLFLNYLKENEGQMPELDKTSLELDPNIFKGDRHRPQYHLIAPAYWMNEPHSPFYFKGKYHLFYQHNPKGPYWNHIHWGHWISEDLVNWENLPIALEPGRNDFDPDGIWSGNATYDLDGLPVIFYTAGNFNKNPDQAVARARTNYPEDRDLELKKWNKENKILIEKPEDFNLTANDFRDPFPWKEDDSWYCLVGSGIKNTGGTALIYKSTDFENWEFKGHFMEIDYSKFPYLGPVWELPVLLPVKTQNKEKEKYIFLISPVGKGADVEVFYWLGDWDKENCRFIPEHEEPRLIDYGDFHFTGPSGMVDPETGRSIIFTIAQGERTPAAEFNSGWAHNGGLPLSLYLDSDSKLAIKPIAELNKLRNKKILSIKDSTQVEANQKLKKIKGDMLEIKLTLSSFEAEKYGIKVRRSPAGEEETLIFYDNKKKIFGIDRRNTTLADEERCGGIQTGDFSLEKNQKLNLHIYLDKSMIEAYANNKKMITSRAYPARKDSLDLKIWSEAEVFIDSLEIWEMNAINY